jgi:hypothetical protein
MTADEHKQIVDHLVAFLDSAIKGLGTDKRTGVSKLPLDAGDQYAVRVLQSRIRALDHSFFAEHGSPEERIRSALALGLKDNGELLTYANVNHSHGRLDCTACDFLYIGVRREPQCRVCRFCSHGVEHVRTVYGPAEYSDTVGLVTVQEGDVYRWFVCDECGSRSLMKVEETT